MKKIVLFVLVLTLASGLAAFAAGEKEAAKPAAERNILTMSCNQEFGTIDPQRGND